MRSTLALSLLLFACDGAPPPAAAPPAADFVRTPDPVLTSVGTAEQIADRALRRGLGMALCEALVRRDAGALRVLFTDDFRARLVGPATSTETTSAAITLATAPPDPTELDVGDAVAKLLGALEADPRLARCDARWPALVLAEDPTWGRAEVVLEIVGAATRTMRWTVELAKVGEAWRMRRLESGPWQIVSGRGPRFVDVTDQVGVALPMSATAVENQRDRVDFGARETVGGLAVVDWDGDGLQDLLAWHRQRILTLFRNDGYSGFQPHHDLIAPREVGDAMLFVDLDGDGNLEAVSSEVSGCADDIGRLGLYTREGTTLKPVAPLTFRRPCHELSGADLREVVSVVYEHVTAGDVDGDGDLDLFVAGFRGRQSRRDAFNFHDSSDGERDLLFINQGGLKFAEESETRLPKDRRWTYNGLLHDADGDGDLDLYTATLYGPNGFARNDGQGRFEATANAFSQDGTRGSGLTLVDLDEDGALDLFVSNPWAAAGQRIATQIAPRIPADHGAGFARTSAGNLALSKGADIAPQLGLADAGWAWGHAAVDLDNDGHRDLLVSNGGTTHSEKPESDLSSLLWMRIGAHVRLRVADNADSVADDAAAQIAAESFNGSHAGRQRDRAFLRAGGGFVDAGAALGLDLDHDGRAVVAFDFDGDGDQDLATMGLQSLRILRNDLPKRRFVRVRATRGAEVRVTAGGRTQVASVPFTAGFHTQPAVDVHVGLGDVEKVDRVAVRWPGGKTVDVAAPAVDQRLTVTPDGEGTSAPLKAWDAYLETRLPEASMPVMNVDGRLGRVARAGGPTLVLGLEAQAPVGAYEPISRLAMRRRGTLTVIGVATAVRTPEKLIAVAQAHRLPFPVVLATAASREAFSELGGCLFDSRGRLVRIWRSGVPPTEVEARIDAEHRKTARTDHWELALRYAQGSGRERARKVMEAALTEHPDDLLSWRRYAEVLMVNQDRQAALRALAAAVGLNENDANVWADLAQVLSMGGQAERAQQRVDKALQLDPSNARALTVAGVVMWLKGDRAGSRQFLEAAVEMDPYYEPAQRSLARAKDPKQKPGPPKKRRDRHDRPRGFGNAGEPGTGGPPHGGHGPDPGAHGPDPGHDGHGHDGRPHPGPEPGHEGHGHDGRPHPGPPPN